MNKQKQSKFRLLPIRRTAYHNFCSGRMLKGLCLKRPGLGFLCLKRPGLGFKILTSTTSLRPVASLLITVGRQLPHILDLLQGLKIRRNLDF